MIAPYGKIIVSADLQQRSNYMIRYGSLELWMDSSFGEDGKHTNPQLATIMNVGENVDFFKEGMKALCHYNTFTSFVTPEYRYGSHEKRSKEGEDLFTIAPERIRCYLAEDGRPLPAPGYVLVGRVMEELKSTIIIPDVAKKHMYKWFVLKEPGQWDGGEAGDMVLCEMYADLHVKYTIDKVPTECFVVKVEDIIGVMKP